MNIILKIQRFNPATDKQPYVQEYTVDVGPNERLLDALMQIKRFQDGSLGFRKSCAHGVCGSDAMRINGKDGLACKTLVKDVVEKEGDTVTVEPLQHLPVLRDLIVNQDDFFKKYRSVQPFLINDEKMDRQERLQSPEDRLVFDDTTNCILCAACYSSCPILETKPDYIGPAACVQAFRFIADSRDRATNERLQMVHTSDGVWACDNHFKCTQCCPRSILITKRINQTKQMIKELKKVNK